MNKFSMEPLKPFNENLILPKEKQTSKRQKHYPQKNIEEEHDQYLYKKKRTMKKKQVEGWGLKIQPCMN